MKRLVVFFLALGAFAPVAGQWVEKTIPAGDAFNSVSVQGVSTVYATRGSEFYKSTNAGGSWTLRPWVFTNLDPANPSLFNISSVQGTSFVDENVGLVSARSGSFGATSVILRTTNGGDSWTLVHAAPFLSLHLAMRFVTPSIAYAVGAFGRAYKSGDGGITWSLLNSGTTEVLRNFHFSDASNGVIVGDNVVLRTSDGGDSWTITQGTTDFVSVFFSTPLQGLAIANGDILKTVNGGGTWTPHASNLDGSRSYKELKFIDELTGFVTSDQGVFKTVDGGNFWQPQPSAGSYNVQAFDAMTTGMGFIVSNPPIKSFHTQTLGENLMNEAATHSLISYPTSLCRGIYPITIKLSNQGLALLTSATLRWSVDDVEQTPFLWAGNVLTGNSSDAIQVGAFNFTRTARDYTIKVWSTLPNGQPDEGTLNDLTTGTLRFNKFIGNYVIGAGSLDFTTINQVTSLLNANGICDDVLFSIKSGQYNEGLALTNVPGTAPDRRITFQSESGVREDVIIESGDPFLPVDINGTSHVTIRSLTVKSSSPNRTIVIRGIESDIIIEDNLVVPTLPTSTAVGVEIQGTKAEIQIRNNKFQNFNWAINQVQFDATYPVQELLIEGNLFEHQRLGAIYTQYVLADFTIRNNLFIALPSAVSYSGLSSSSNIARAIISNNYFQILGVPTAWGVSTTTNNDLKIIHNTFNLNTPSSGLAIVAGSSGTLTIQNNNVANYGKGTLLTVQGVIGNFVVDYNNLYSATNAIGFFPGNPEVGYGNTLQGWQNVSGLDLHSISVNPQLTTGPHLQPNSSNYALNGAGSFLAGFAVDIDGQARNPSGPDIGIDEFDIPANDLAISVLDGQEVTCSGNRTIWVMVKNYGINAQPNFTVNLKVDGVDQTPVNVPTPLAPGQSMDVNLGTFAMTSGPHPVEARVFAPADDNGVNDISAATVNVGGMSGTFTIGGATPNYNTIGQAIAALNAGGVCGPVTFNIRPGTYTEQLTLTEVAGASEANQIIFQSESLDNNTVIIAATQNTVTFQGGDWISFRHVGIATTLPAADMIRLQGGADHNTVESCQITGYWGAAISSTNTSVDEFNTIINNHFNTIGQPGIGIRIAGLWAIGGTNWQFERGNVIRGNTFGPTILAASLTFQDSFTFSDNSIESSGNGIEVINAIGPYDISGNSIKTDLNGSAITLTRALGLDMVQGKIINNMIHSGIGLFANTSDNFLFLNNTVVTPAASLIINSNLVDGAPYDQIEVRNNIIVNRSAGSCLSYHPSMSIQSDYNTFYSPHTDPFVLRTGGGSPTETLFKSIHSWNEKTGLDVNSRFLLPRFVSETDFHIQNDVRLNGMGSPVTLSLDFDKEPRNQTTPDIGADEFDHLPVPNDIGVTNVTHPAACDHEYLFKARIRNYGSNTLTNAKVYWSLNGPVHGPVNWTGSLAPGQESAEFPLSSMNVAPPTGYEVRVWTDSPNGLPDGDPVNDTTRLPGIFQKLNGGYVVGSSPNFTSLESVASYLNAVGICGPVTISLPDGDFNENMALGEIEGSSAVNRITISGFPGQSRIHGDNFGILLDGTDYVTIADLEFHTGSGSASILLRKETVGNELLNNKFVGNLNPGWAHSAFIEFGDPFGVGGPYVDTKIENNIFEKGTYGISVSWPQAISNTTVLNNTFVNQEYGAINLGFTNHSTRIEGNTIESASEAVAVRVYHATGQLRILKNKISGSFVEGLHIEYSGSVLDPGIIANNMISCQPNQSSPPNPRLGIYSFNTNGLKYLYNTISVTEPSAYGAQAFRSSVDSSMMVKNNIFAYSGVGDAIDVSSVEVATSQIDYNNYWGPDLKFKYNNQDYTSLASFQSATPFEDHGITFDPLFVSATDLHVLNPNLNGKATPVEVITDIDNEPRDPTPDIGADEFFVHSLDAGLMEISLPTSCTGLNDVFVTFKNFGLQTLTQVTITWSINGIAQTPYVWNGTLGPAALTPLLKIGEVNYAFNGTYDFVAATSLPNSLADQNTLNDGKTLSGIKPSIAGTFTVGGSSPNFTTVSQMVASLVERGVCGTVIASIRDGIYNERVVVPVIPGASNTNRIIFQSESRSNAAVTYRYAATSAQDNNVWMIEDGGFITIRDIGMEATGSLYSDCIWINSGEKVQLINNSFTSPENANALVVRASSMAESSIRLNRITGGSTGVYWSANGEYDSIADNLIGNQYFCGIAGGARNLFIKGNKITTDAPVANTYRAISVTEDLARVLNNEIYTFGSGILLSDADRSLVANNFVSIRNGLPIPSIGIRIADCYRTDAFFNSVGMADTDPGSAAFELKTINTSEPVNVRSNIFTNTGGGLVFNYVGGLPNNGQAIIEFNAVYFTGSSIGKNNSTTYSTLAIWEAAGLASNTLLANPLFVSTSDLHASAEELIGAGKPSSEVLVDIDGQARHALYPTPGADEFGLVTINNLSLRDKNSFECNHPAQPIGIFVENNGIVTVTTFTIQWSLNGQPMTPRTWNGSLPKGQEVLYLFTGVSLPVGVPQVLEITITSPNGQPDEDSSNNSIHFNSTVFGKVNLGSDATGCIGSTVQLDAGSIYSTYTWNDGSHDQTLSVTTASEYAINVVDPNGCPSSDAVNVTFVDLNPSITIMGSSGICTDSSVDLRTMQGAGLTYEWRKNGVIIEGQTGFTLTVNEAGDYKATVIATGCSEESNPVTITALSTPAKPVISSDGDMDFCQGESVNLSVPVGFQYLWSTGSTASQISVNASGSFTVRVIDLLTLCSSPTSDAVTVTVRALPLAEITLVNNLLSSSPGNTYQWYLDENEIDGATGQTYSPSESGTYSVEVTTLGCSNMSLPYVHSITAIEDTNLNFEVHPNPTSRFLTLQVISQQTQVANIVLTDVNGKELYPLVNKQASSYVMDLYGIADGIYILQVELDGSLVRRKIVLKR